MKKEKSIADCYTQFAQNYLNMINNMTTNEFLAYALSIPINIAYHRGNMSWNEHRKAMKLLKKVSER